MVDGKDFLYDGRKVGTVTAGEKQFATINTKIVIFPDKVYYDTKEDKFGNLAAEYSGYAGNVTFTTNTLTVPEQSYIDQAETESYTLSGVAANTSITVYTGASIDKGNGKLTMSGGSATTPDKLKNGDLIQHKCDTAKGVHGGPEQRQAERRDLSNHLYHARGAAAHKYPEFKDVFQGRGCNRDHRLHDLCQQQRQPYHPLPCPGGR